MMDKFENVTIIKKANIYFEGKVTSRTVVFGDGSKKTLGMMQPGQYEFATGDKEEMEILAGKIRVLLPQSGEWQAFEAGQTFAVPANCKFQVAMEELVDYCCSYIKE